jgi:two-component system heavy metal sensor histidine kinase CusS
MIGSISLRLAAWYALAATVTLAGLFVVGYQLLGSYLIHGLDQLNKSEYAQIRARLGPKYETLTARDINERIRATTKYASVLFYIEVDRPGKRVVFFSNNLDGQALPDVPRKHRFDGTMPGIGRLRLSEFILPPLDITIATSSEQVYKDMDGYVEVCMSLLVAMLGVSTLIGFALSRMALRPVRLIRQTALRIGSDNLSERIPVSGVRDEISDLARLLNQMFDRLEYSFNEIRRFTAEASHELKTPLSLIRLQAEKLLVTGNLPLADEESVQMQLEELGRMNRIIDELLFLSRAEARAITLQLKRQDPRRFLGVFAQDARVLAEYHGRYFELRCDGEGSVVFETQRIRQVLLNLLVNALHASPPGGTVTVTSSLSGGLWRVSLEDQGPGIPASDRERIFERFVRLGKRPMEDQGSGLGLAICRSIIELHGGRIWAEAASAAGGLRVVFEIPVGDSVAIAAALGVGDRASGSRSAEAEST